MSHPLSEANSVSLGDLTDQNMIVQSLPCDIRISLDDHLRRHGIVLENMMEVSQNDSILSLVKNGVGLAILPKMAVASLDNGLKAIPIISEDFNREISLLTYSKDLHDLIVKLIE